MFYRFYIWLLKKADRRHDGCDHVWHGRYGMWDGNCRKCDYPALYIYYDKEKKNPYSF